MINVQILPFSIFILSKLEKAKLLSSFVYQIHVFIILWATITADNIIGPAILLFQVAVSTESSFYILRPSPISSVCGEIREVCQLST